MSERFDILVVGAGPAGIAAAVSARLRASVLDWWTTILRQAGKSGEAGVPGPRLRAGGTQGSTPRPCCGFRDGASSMIPKRGTLRAECNERVPRPALWAGSILATGARERFLPFPGWTLPNVMGAGGLGCDGAGRAADRRKARGGGRNRPAAAGGGGASGAPWRKDRRHVRTGSAASIRCPLRCEPAGEPAKLLQGIAYGMATRGARFYTGCWPIAASGTEKLESVTLQRNGKTLGRALRLPGVRIPSGAQPGIAGAAGVPH